MAIWQKIVSKKIFDQLASQTVFFLKIVMKVLTRSYCLLPCKSSVAYTGVLHEVLLALARVFLGMSGTDLSLHSDATLLASGPAGGSVMFMKLVAASGSLWTMPADDLCREHWQPAKTNDKPNFTDFHVSFAFFRAKVGWYIVMPTFLPQTHTHAKSLQWN